MVEEMEQFEAFFRAAFGHAPFNYQRCLATSEELYTLVNVPTGAGKTAAILGAWLWRRLHRPTSVGRRLVYCLPMRTLVEQTERVARTALAELTKRDPVTQERFGVHVLMGGDVSDAWDMAPESECILIGTQDMLLSRALNRGYAMSRFRWPVHFGLLNNDCLWVFDEIQLMGDGLPTSTQLVAFRDQYTTFGPHHALWMSATLAREWLRTVDFMASVDGLPALELSDVDRATPSLAQRLNAVKHLAPAPVSCRTSDGLAAFVKERHTPGTQTLVVVNRVARARETFLALAKLYGQTPSRGGRQNAPPGAAERTPALHVLHSRFRPHERRAWPQLLSTPPGESGRIIVATQVIEAGVDVSSQLLITDLAPYASLVQRFGRCNRTGEFPAAQIFWVDRPCNARDTKLATQETLDGKEQERIAAPYAWEDLGTAQNLLRTMSSAAPAALPQHHDPFRPAHVLRRRDLLDLFDTTPDLSGYDLDISRFVRGGVEQDVAVAWRDLGGHAPVRTVPRPGRDELCPVSIGDIRTFLRGKDRTGKPRQAWMWQALDGLWQRVSDNDLRPGLTLLLDTTVGGYDRQRGWDESSRQAVEVVPSYSASDEALGDDPLTYRRYAQTLTAHSREARMAAEQLLHNLNDLGLEPWSAELLFATHHHDLGKAHPVFQHTLQGLTPEATLQMPWLAKSTQGGVHARPHFRHELASALALLQRGAGDLSVYLAACHHGKVRLSIRALPGETQPDTPETPYARGIWDGDTLPEADLGDGVVIPALTLDLEPLLLGLSAEGARSWLDRMLALRDRLGVFRLAYLECLIRAADVRASVYPQEVL
jgi:CRISPR-associated endonuclease/helicase Cas3